MEDFVMTEKKKASSQWDMFHGLWQTVWPAIKGDNVIYWWEKFCNGADWSMLEEAFQILADQKRIKGKKGIETYPAKLSDLKDVYYSLRDKKRMMHHDEDGECICCKGSGWVNVVERLDGGKWTLCDPTKVIYASSEVKMGIFVGPCTCKYGPKNYKYEYREECVKNRFGSAIDAHDGKMEAYIESCYNAPHTPDMLDGMPQVPEIDAETNHTALNGYIPDSYPSAVKSVSESLIECPAEVVGSYF